MLTQAWVDKMIASDLAGPDVVGPPRDEADDKVDAWTLRYIARFVELGFPIYFALETYRAGEHDLSIDPVEAADDEISYFCDDGDSNV